MWNNSLLRQLPWSCQSTLLLQLLSEVLFQEQEEPHACLVTISYFYFKWQYLIRGLRIIVGVSSFRLVTSTQPSGFYLIVCKLWYTYDSIQSLVLVLNNGRASQTRDVGTSNSNNILLPNKKIFFTHLIYRSIYIVSTQQ